MSPAKSTLLVIALSLLVTFTFSCAACLGEKAKDSSSKVMKIRIKVGQKSLPATLRGNGTARDFMSLIPLTLTLKDFAKAEKISDLPRRLDQPDASTGSDPSVGDIAYYAPWGSLAIFYKDSGYANGLIILGSLETKDDLKALNETEIGTVTFEKAEP